MHHLSSASAAAFRIAFFCFIINASAENTLPKIVDSSAIEGTKKEIFSPGLSLLNKNAPDSSLAGQQASTKELFVRLGEFHRLQGIYSLLVGTFGIIAGVVLLDKSDSVPFAITCMSLGGVSIGLGIWEIKIGCGLRRNDPHLR